MIIVTLGSNLSSPFGAPDATIRRALDTLSAQLGSLDRVSHLWRSPAWPDANDPPFVNAITSIRTTLPPMQLLDRLHAIENTFGRQRSESVLRNAPRTLDLDIIDYDGLVQEGPPELPHPRMQERAFVLVPLEEIAPDWRHPVTGQSVDALISALPEGARTIERIV